MRDDPSELLDLAEWYRELAHVGRDHHRRDRTYRWQSTWKGRSWISESQRGWIGTRAESALNCGFGATAQAAEPTGFTAK